MKKVAIITLNGYFNYGNRLQNYALQEVIKSLGHDVDTIMVNRNMKNKEGRILRVLKNPKKLLVIFKRFKINKKNEKISIERSKNFKQFSKKYISETEYYISENNIPSDLSNKFDFFVVGSDQVWNPFTVGKSGIYFLSFAPKEKRIAYAPSFGISNIPLEYKEEYKVLLSSMGKLSVREKAGAEIIKNLSGRTAQILVDPTLLLSKEKWLSVSQQVSNKPKDSYLLTYFLGDISSEKQKKIKEIATLKKLKVINLSNIKDKDFYESGPSEFIDYINSAEIFLTDSFHGVVFSILLETPFIVFNRKDNQPSMNSRIDTLLETFKFESRFSDKLKSNNEIFNLDFSHVHSILKEERERALNYLKEAIK